MKSISSICVYTILLKMIDNAHFSYAQLERGLLVGCFAIQGYFMFH